MASDVILTPSKPVAAPPMPSRFALTAPQIAGPDGLVGGSALLLENGRVRALVAERDLPGGWPVRRLERGVLAPGFVDLQVNGGGGVLFNDQPDVAALTRIGAAHRRFGTTSFLPTLISDGKEVRRQAVAAVRAAIAAGVPGVVGLHLEGPHLAEARRGVHGAGHLGPPDAEDLDLMTAQACGRVLVTVAPEIVGPETIARLVGAGSVVALGHSDAGYDVATRAFKAGATGATHLFNAMPPVAGREPGLVGAVLDHPDVWCGLIVDGHHVHPANVRLAFKIKGRRLVLVTDAMPPVGASNPSFHLYGAPITVAGGRCVTADGRLAGTALDMAAAVRRAVADGIDLASALRAASAAPADAIGLGDRIGSLRPGYRADLVWVDENLSVLSTWSAGNETRSDETRAD